MVEKDTNEHYEIIEGTFSYSGTTDEFGSGYSPRSSSPNRRGISFDIGEDPRRFYLFTKFGHFGMTLGQRVENARIYLSKDTEPFNLIRGRECYEVDGLSFLDFYSRPVMTLMNGRSFPESIEKIISKGIEGVDGIQTIRMGFDPKKIFIADAGVF